MSSRSSQWVACQQGVEVVARRDHAQDVLHGEAASPNDRLSAEDLRIDCDALKKLVFSHD